MFERGMRKHKTRAAFIAMNKRPSSHSATNKIKGLYNYNILDHPDFIACKSIEKKIANYTLKQTTAEVGDQIDKIGLSPIGLSPAGNPVHQLTSIARDQEQQKAFGLIALLRKNNWPH